MSTENKAEQVESLDISAIQDKAASLTRRKENISRKKELLEAELKPHLKRLDELRKVMREKLGTDDPEVAKKMLDEKKRTITLELDETAQQCDEAERILERADAEINKLNL